MTTYYLDAAQGRDAHDGKSPESAWKSLKRAQRQDLEPGDALLLKRGCSWQGAFRLKGSGTRARPITLGTYGAGPKPRLKSKSFPILGNVGPISYWHVKGLELCGEAAFDPFERRQGEDHGIYFHQASRSQGMLVEDCVVHDVSGSGIAFSAAEQGQTAFQDWTVRECEVYNAGTGIATQGPWPPQGPLERVFRCHTRFKVEHCRVHDIATDGIVLHYCQDGVIEHCKAWRTGLGQWHRTPVGIWYFLARRCVIQYCESFDNHSAGGHADGGGFDLDGGCVDCVMQYNYSHDNDGAGYLICSYEPQGAPCVRCVARFNLSVNDGRMNDYAAIQIWQADDCQIYNNTCITRISSSIKFASDTRGHLFANNLFVIDSKRPIPHIQCEFEMSSNHFENNVYWRRGGKAFFKLKGSPKLLLADVEEQFRSRDERDADPRLSALSGPNIHLQPGSPALNGARAISNMGTRDLYAVPLPKRGARHIGASQAEPKPKPKPKRARRPA